MRRDALALALTLAACAPAPPVLSPRVVHGITDEPYLGADRIVVEVERGGVTLAGARAEVAVPATTFELAEVPFGRELVLRVESRLGDVVLARGRSFPFDYPAAAEAPELAPDVYLGTLGRFSRSIETERVFVALTPTRTGALGATFDGEIVAYAAHGAADGSATLTPLASLTGRSGASWVGVDVEGDGGLLGVGGPIGGAVLVRSDGQVVAELSASAFGAVDEIALAAATDGSWILAIGGRDVGGAPVSDVVRIDHALGTLAATSLEPLAGPRALANVVRVTVDEAPGLRDVVLVAGGGMAGLLELIDADGRASPTVSVDPPLDERALVALSTGLVVAAGGSDAAGAPTDAVDLFVVRVDQRPAIARITPVPPPLYAARRGATALALGPGLALLAGGVDALSTAVPGAELVEVRLDALPARVVPTGALPAAARVSCAVRLADRSVLVGGPGLLAVYISPRGP